MKLFILLFALKAIAAHPLSEPIIADNVQIIPPEVGVAPDGTVIENGGQIITPELNIVGPARKLNILGGDVQEVEGIIVGAGGAQSGASVIANGGVRSDGIVSSNGIVASSGAVVANGGVRSDGVVAASGAVVANGGVQSQGFVGNNGGVRNDGFVNSVASNGADGIVANNGGVRADGIIGSAASNGAAVHSQGFVGNNGGVRADGIVANNGGVRNDGFVNAAGSNGVAQNQGFVDGNNGFVGNQGQSNGGIRNEPVVVPFVGGNDDGNGGIRNQGSISNAGAIISNGGVRSEGIIAGVGSTIASNNGGVRSGLSSQVGVVGLNGVNSGIQNRGIILQENALPNGVRSLEYGITPQVNQIQGTHGNEFIDIRSNTPLVGNLRHEPQSGEHTSIDYANTVLDQRPGLSSQPCESHHTSIDHADTVLEQRPGHFSGNREPVRNLPTAFNTPSTTTGNVVSSSWINTPARSIVYSGYSAPSTGIQGQAGIHGQTIRTYLRNENLENEAENWPIRYPNPVRVTAPLRAQTVDRHVVTQTGITQQTPLRSITQQPLLAPFINTQTGATGHYAGNLRTSGSRYINSAAAQDSSVFNPVRNQDSVRGEPCVEQRVIVPYIAVPVSGNFFNNDPSGFGPGTLSHPSSLRNTQGFISSGVGQGVFPAAAPAALALQSPQVTSVPLTPTVRVADPCVATRL